MDGVMEMKRNLGQRGFRMAYGSCFFAFVILIPLLFELALGCSYNVSSVIITTTHPQRG